MILYLTTNSKTNLLDFLVEKTEIAGLSIKKMIGSFNLQNFMISDMRNFSHLTEVVLERTAFDDTDSEFISAIEEFMTMYSIRVTVIYEGLSSDSNTFKNLLNIGVGNIVIDTDIYEIQNELLECFSDNGMQRYNVKEREKEYSTDEHYNFTCENIRIGIVGSQKRVGVTTMSVGLTNWLSDVGATSCYIEANNTKKLEYLAREFDEEMTQTGFITNNTLFTHTEPEKNYNFKVYNLANTINMDIIGAMDIVIVLCGIKMYELPYTANILEKLKRTYTYICPIFLDKDRRIDYAHLFQTEFFTPIYLEYQPNILNHDVNKKNYKQIINKYIATV